MLAFAFFVLFALSACTAKAPLSYPTVRGVYATATGDADSKEILWLSGFSWVEAGGLWAPPSSAYRALQEKNVLLLGYDWMPATYHEPDGEDPPLAAWLYKNRAWASLNPEGPFPHCQAMGYDCCEDYYFDYGNPQVIDIKAQYLLDAVSAGNWNGIFFDWAPGVFIEEPEYQSMAEIFAVRHPEDRYLDAVGRFYAELKEKAPGIVVSNQGFRNPENVLPFVDLDMTESFAVGEAYLGKKLKVLGRGEVNVPDTIYYPVSEDFKKGTLKDTLFWLEELARLGREYGGEGFQGFLYMNYAAPRFVPAGDGTHRAEMPKNAILFGYAVPKLLGFTGYTEVPFDRRLERLPVYQADLGRPLGVSYEFQDGVYVRFYERGLVLIGELEGPKTIRLRSPYLRAGWLYDFYTERWLPAREGALELALEPERDPVTGRMAPVGRVLVYAK